MVLRPVVFYISGHGFGHASRQIEIIDALHARVPELPIMVRTSAPRWLFELAPGQGFSLAGRAEAPLRIQFDPLECDTGAIQPDSLHLDEEATVRQAAEFHAGLAAKAAREKEYLRENRAALVIADAPPLACVAAADAGVPAYVVANFTWDWIYADYSEHLGPYPWLVPALRDAYATAAGAWRLPMWGGFESIGNVVDVPLVARRARHTREETRRRFNLPFDAPVVLVSFGGLGLGAGSVGATPASPLHRDYTILTVGGNRSASDLGIGHVIDEGELYGAGFRYEDLVAAADVVVTKPGYGILSECIANDAAVLYTSRGRFREYDVLVREFPRFARAEFIPQESLFAGRWGSYLRHLLSQPEPSERPRTDGADVIAEKILGLI